MRGGEKTTVVSLGVVEEASASAGRKSMLSVLAQAVGVAVTIGSFTLKVPQISKCIAASSVDGMSLLGAYFEFNTYLASSIYHFLQGYPLSTWAENLSLVAQQSVVIGLLWALSVVPPSSLHKLLFVSAELLLIGGMPLQCLGELKFNLYISCQEP
jgi:hypothetical protein